MEEVLLDMTNVKGPYEEVTKFENEKGLVPGGLGARKKCLREHGSGQKPRPGGREGSGEKRSEKQEGARQVWPHMSGVGKLWPRGQIWPAACFVQPMS